MKNIYTVDGDTARVFITMKDGTEVCALVDTEDIPKIAPYRWHAAKQKDGFRIVCHMKIEPSGPKRAIYMHRVVSGAPKEKFVDHINCDPADNRKANLRFSDYKANGQNRKSLHPTNTSGYRNVTWDQRLKRWKARFIVNGKAITLGYYKDVEVAAAAAAAGRAKYMPFSQEALSP